MSGAKGEKAFLEFHKAFEEKTAKRATSKRPAPAKEEDDDVQFLRSTRRKATATPVPSSSKKKSKTAVSTPKTSPSSTELSTVLANLNAKVFTSAPVSSSGKDPRDVIRSL